MPETEQVINMGNQWSCCEMKSNENSIPRSQMESPGGESYGIPSMHHKLQFLIDQVYKKRHTSITAINLTSKGIGEEGGRYLSVVLPYYSHIEKLILRGCELGPLTCQSLGPPLKELSKLNELDLSLNEISPESAQKLSEGLVYLRKLEILNLDNTKLGPRGMAIISECLLMTRKLKHLSIANNDIGSSGATRLSKVLQDLQELNVLDISDNKIEEEGALALAKGLKHLIALEKLNIGNNNIRDNGLTCILDSCSSKLTELVLEKNQITDTGLYELVNRIENFGLLSVLILDHNCITDRSASALALKIGHLQLEILGLVGCEVFQSRKELSIAATTTEILF